MKSEYRKKAARIRMTARAMIGFTLIILLLIVLLTVLDVARAETVACAAISEGTLNVRDRPGLDGEKIGYLDPGEEVVILGYEKGWALCEVHFEASTGYIKAEYLTVDLDASGEYVNTSGGRVRIRDGINGKMVDWLKADAVVNVMSWSADDDGTRWAFIGRGWVREDCLSRNAGER